jgi:prepilin-type N-terminal cleavage/methylation domain-containing protein
MRMRHSAPQSGFSLIELVVGLAILTVIMSAAFSLMARGQQSFDSNQILSQSHQNAEFALQRVGEIIRGSGCNPTNVTSINSLQFVQSGSTTASIRVLSDMDGDGAFTDLVTTSSTSTAWAIDPRYLILSAEDVTIEYFADATTVTTSSGTVSIPGRSITLKDNASSTPTPVVIAQNIMDFQAVPSADGRDVLVSVTAGPNPPFSANDPRYRTYTTGTRIRLRNR